VKNKKGQPGEGLPFFRPQGRDEPHIAQLELRQVIAERGPDHVVDGVRTNTGPCHASGGIEVVTGVNLPMILKLSEQVPEESLAEIAKRVRDSGKEGIHLAGELLAPPTKAE